MKSVNIMCRPSPMGQREVRSGVSPKQLAALAERQFNGRMLLRVPFKLARGGLRDKGRRLRISTLIGRRGPVGL